MNVLGDLICEYSKRFPDSELIPFGYTPLEPSIDTEDDLIEAYRRCLKENKRWELLFRDVSDEDVIY